MNIWSTTSFTWFSLLTDQSDAVILRHTELLSVQISESRGSRIWDQASLRCPRHRAKVLFTQPLSPKLLLPILCQTTGSGPPSVSQSAAISV